MKAAVGAPDRCFHGQRIERHGVRPARIVPLSRQVMPVFQWRRAPARWLRGRLLAIPQRFTDRQGEWLYRGGL